VDGKPCPDGGGRSDPHAGLDLARAHASGARPRSCGSMRSNVPLAPLHGDRPRFQPGPAAEPPGPRSPTPLSRSPNVVPDTAYATKDYSPVFRYPYASAATAGGGGAAPARDGSRRVRYINPLTGGTGMALMDCFPGPARSRHDHASVPHQREFRFAAWWEGAGESQVGDPDHPLEESATSSHCRKANRIVHRSIGGTARLFSGLRPRHLRPARPPQGGIRGISRALTPPPEKVNQRCPRRITRARAPQAPARPIFSPDFNAGSSSMELLIADHRNRPLSGAKARVAVGADRLGRLSFLRVGTGLVHGYRNQPRPHGGRNCAGHAHHDGRRFSGCSSICTRQSSFFGGSFLRHPDPVPTVVDLPRPAARSQVRPSPCVASPPASLVDEIAGLAEIAAQVGGRSGSRRFEIEDPFPSQGHPLRRRTATTTISSATISSATATTF